MVIHLFPPNERKYVRTSSAKVDREHTMHEHVNVKSGITKTCVCDSSGNICGRIIVTRANAGINRVDIIRAFPPRRRTQTDPSHVHVQQFVRPAPTVASELQHAFAAFNIKPRKVRKNKRTTVKRKQSAFGGGLFL